MIKSHNWRETIRTLYNIEIVRNDNKSMTTPMCSWRGRLSIPPPPIPYHYYSLAKKFSLSGQNPIFLSDHSNFRWCPAFVLPPRVPITSLHCGLSKGNFSHAPWPHILDESKNTGSLLAFDAPVCQHDNVVIDDLQDVSCHMLNIVLMWQN